MTVADAIRQAARTLSDSGDRSRHSARIDAEWLMAAALGVTRSNLLLMKMQDTAPAAFAPMVARCKAGEPLAYVTGIQGFYGHDFSVSPAVLIPRADSESIVEAALKVMPDDARILDCGTGSGALLLTLLAECEKATGVGIDRSQEALAMAARNAAGLAVDGRVDLVGADWTQPGWSDALGRFDLVIANPPYVEDDAELDPGVRFYEPHQALFAGPEGLDDYRILIPQLPALLAAGGVAVIEIGWRQAEAVSAIARHAGASTEIIHDLAHRPRGLVLRFGVGKAPAKG